MTDIAKEIQKLAEANLPAATAGAMKEFIEKAEEAESILKDAQQVIKNQEKTIEVKNKTISELRSDLMQAEEQNIEQADLEKRRKNVQDREIKQDLKEAQIRLSEANTRNETIERLVEKVFGHPGVRVESVKQTPLMTLPDSNGCSYQTGSTTESEITGTTHTKT